MGSEIGEVAFRAEPADIGVGKSVVSAQAHGEAFPMVPYVTPVALNGLLI